MDEQKKQPLAIACGFCDFSSGQRGMDHCSRCDGTGSQFAAAGRRFPNTRAGYAMACEALEVEPEADSK